MRSILFVPADRAELVSKAMATDAAMVCLDLEDGVAHGAKAAARAALPSAVAEIVTAGRRAAVRINADLDMIGHDLDALPAALTAIVLPKAGSRHQLAQLAEALERRFGAGAPEMIAMVEDANGLDALNTDRGAWPARLGALALGTEDLAADLGTAPDAPPVAAALNALAHLAARQGVALLGYPGSIAEFRDLALFEATARAGREAGSVGGFAIHPRQVPVLNTVFGMTENERAEANRVVEAFETALAEGQGATQLDGRMIDRPVYLAARRRLGSA
ncbi:MAG: hypothetical protein JJ924_13630 [Roseitalea sp.]|nr:hypothetical protein [Roseitalea sp.]MBO6666398.1 hypothetical protein [Roseitalea sp.]MBO6707499.1 hypothetical protein [Roseitalea sp.]MBO6733825.1 hypothetical protein [Roseitalea sp.]